MCLLLTRRLDSHSNMIHSLPKYTMISLQGMRPLLRIHLGIEESSQQWSHSLILDSHSNRIHSLPKYTIISLQGMRPLLRIHLGIEESSQQWSHSLSLDSHSNMIHSTFGTED